MKWTVWGIIFYIHALLVFIWGASGSGDVAGTITSMEEMSYYAMVELGYMLTSGMFFISGTILIGFGAVIKRMDK